MRRVLPVGIAAWLGFGGAGVVRADLRTSEFVAAAHNHAPRDAVVFGPRSTEVSYGRSPDGSDRWRMFRRATPGSANVCPGDLNCDRAVSFDDIDAFVVALSGQAAYEAAYPQCPRWNADCNADGAVDCDDIDAFVAALAGG